MTVRRKTGFAIRWLKTNVRFAGLALQCLISPLARHEFTQMGHYYLGVADRAPRLPTIPLEKIVGEDTVIQLTAFTPHLYNVTVHELAVICAIVANRGPQRIFEIGTFDGRTTLNLRNNTPSDSQVVTLDLPPDEQNLPDGRHVGELLEKPDTQNILQLYGNSQTMDFSEYRGQFDFVFVDAAHDYDSVANDSLVALSLIRPDRSSTIIWHDYVRFAGVTRAVDELIEKVDQPKQFCRIENTTFAYLRTN